MQTITINGRTYTIISRQDLGFDATRVTVETKGGDRKTAMFTTSTGAFDCWETYAKTSHKYSRVNMRSSKSSKYGSR